MGEDQGLSLRDTLSLFFRRVYLLYVVVVALPLGVLITCMLVKPVYESTAKVIVTAKRETSTLLQYTREMAPQMSFNLNVDETDLNSEMELLRSPELWIRTVKKLGVKTFKTGKTGMIKGWLKHVNEMLGRPLSRKKLQVSAAERESAEIQQIAEGLIKDLKITAVVKSKVLDLSFKYSDPVMAQKILATALAEYIPYHMEVYALPGAQKFFSGQSDLYKRRYEEADRDLAEFKKKWGLSLAERQKTELITFIKQIQDALVYVNSNRSQYKIMLAAVKKGYLPSGQLAAGAQRGSENTFINIVSAQLLRAVQKQWQTAEAYQPGSRDYRATADMVTDLTKKYAEALQGELNVVEAKKMSLEQSLKEKEEQLALLEEKSEEARRKQLDVSVAKERYLRYMSKEEEARLENLKGGSQVRDVSVVGKPLTPADPVFPKTFLFVLGAFFLAIPVGMGAILTAHFLDHTFDNPRTLGAHTGYPVLASLGKVQTSKSAAPQVAYES